MCSREGGTPGWTPAFAGVQGMMLELIPHPANGSSAIRSVIAIARREGSRLSLAFRPLGQRALIKWPVVVPQGFSDGLWQHSCFEAFVGAEGDAAYVEINLSPSTRWAAYRFDGYRSGMRPAQAVPTGRIQWMPAANCTLRANLDIPDLPADQIWQLNLSTVIELLDGTKLYFALTHPEGNPDFHNRDCFAATLTVTSTA